ncbi:dUTP diphosphatase, partial [Patescibacteria group bacterium]|nr:dUTP diphosphatase [Patescibacteria group bacterium]
PRSGLASRHGITLSNTPGTADPDYRGEVGAILFNHSQKSFYLKQGMRIAQIIFQKAIIPEIQQVKEYSQLSNTKRGAGGFGSTGLK